MRAIRRLLSRALTSAVRRDEEARWREEFETHLHLQVEENLRAGMSPAEARRRAVLTFGPTESITDSCRDQQALPLLEDFFRDVRYAFRQLRRSRAFTFAAIASLAMGIGANAAVFTIVERLLLRALPVAKPHELVYVTDERILTQANPRVSYPFYDVVRQNPVLNGVAARAALDLNLTLNGQTSRVSGELVSGNYFTVLGAATEPGRPLLPDDDTTPGAHAVAVISEPFWQRTFASDPAIVGRSLLLNGQPFMILGVAANGFTGTETGQPIDVWIPLAMQGKVGRNLLTDPRTNWLEMVGRLRAGHRREQASDALNLDVQRRASALPAQGSVRRLVLAPAGRGRSPARGEQKSALLATFALTGLALALAVVNVAGLAAVRSAARDKELAIRLAIGAGRSRLDRQLLTEALVIATLGGVAALLFVPWSSRALIAAYSTPLVIGMAPDARVLALVALTSILSGLVVAMMPMVASRRISPAPGSSRAGAVPGLPAHDAIVTVQIAVALSMLISAALLVQSLRGFNSVDPGFRTDNLLLASLDPASAGYESNRIEGFWRAALDRIGRLPGVQSVSLARTVPLAPGRQRQPWLNPSSGEKIEIDTNFVGPQYFHTIGIAVLSGRDFTSDDGRASRPVVIVNERLARAFWPGQDPIGKGVRLPDARTPTAEIVGVVRDVKYQDLRGEAGPMFYRPVLQTYSSDSMVLHVRAAADPGALVAPIRQAIQDVDRNVPLFHVTTLEEQFGAVFAETRQAAFMAGIFGALAILLSGIGVYAITALAVARRAREIGIRVALGAQRHHIARAIGARVTLLIATGVCLGLLGAWGFTGLTASLVFGVSTDDAATFASMTTLIVLISALAFVIPMRAAIRLDAVAAMRQD